MNITIGVVLAIIALVLAVVLAVIGQLPYPVAALIAILAVARLVP